jgi:hypothetical protein
MTTEEKEYEKVAEIEAEKQFQDITKNFKLPEESLNYIKLCLMSSFCQGAVHGIKSVKNSNKTSLWNS